MAYFTLHRDFRFISALGHTVQFRKGEPTFVAPALHKEVQAFGAEPVDAAEVESILGEEQEQKPEVAQEERHRQLLDAFKALQERNQRGDFTGQGIPAIKALKTLITDFEPAKAEVENLWHLYLDEQNG